MFGLKFRWRKYFVATIIWKEEPVAFYLLMDYSMSGGKVEITESIGYF